MRAFLKRLKVPAMMLSAVFLNSCDQAFPAQTIDISDPQIVDLMPEPANSDRAAEDTARRVLSGEIAEYYTDANVVLSARYFNAQGLAPNSFIIATFTGQESCGTMGCTTYFLKKTDRWQVVEQRPINGIETTRTLLAQAPVFDVQGTADAPKARYNADKAQYAAPSQ